ncbi:protein of unknown function [Caldanaerovirga acetigignens]|uniref:SipL SPOCS domain-containing protein n=1 Tax=Caldanaerovirga acetigignens TaxID=447595 RepID=A0A1M7IYP3_9FIRM|nr:DUF3794 domain-containing protein [Caldanaerovirga acetigignens]SHM45815.1 protein of unknown function [Caldanaerovirga acetigignens]
MALGSTLFLTRELPLAARKIKKVTGKINALNYIILTDKIIVQGVFHKQVFFVGTDDIVHHLSGDMPFKTMLYVPGARPGMTARISAEIEKIRTKLLPGGDSVLTEAIIKVTATVEDAASVTLAPGTDATVLAELVVGESSAQVLVEDTFILENTARKITEINSEVVIQNTELIEGKILVQAVLHNQVYYVGEDDVSYHQAFDMSVSGIVEVAGAQPGMKAYVEPVVELSEAYLVSPGEVFLKAVIGWNVVVVDELLTNIGISALGQNYRVNVLVGQPVTHRHKVESRVLLENEASKVREIKANVSEISAIIVKNKVIIQGVLHKQIYYVGIDGVNRHQAEEVPFSTFVDYEGAMPGHVANLNAGVEYSAFTILNPREVLQKNIIAFNIMVLDPQNLPVILEQGTKVRIPRIVGEATGQVVVSDTEPIVVEGLTVTKAPIVVSEEQAGSRQTQVINTVNVFPPAVGLGETQCEVKNVKITPLENQVLVEGDLSCDVSYIGPDDVVYRIRVDDRFSVLVPLAGCLPSHVVEASAEIEHADFDILPGGDQIRLTIILRAKVRCIKEETVYVVTDVKGPGVTVEKLLVKVKIPTGEIVQLYVVTEVSGGGINFQKRTFVLELVGVGVSPIDIVVDVF